MIVSIYNKSLETTFAAEQHDGAGVWYVGDDRRVLFTVKRQPSESRLREMIEIYFKGKDAGYIAGERQGADAARYELHRALGVDKLLDELADISISIREAAGVKR